MKIAYMMYCCNNAIANDVQQEAKIMHGDVTVSDGESVLLLPLGAATVIVWIMDNSQEYSRGGVTNIIVWGRSTLQLTKRL